MTMPLVPSRSALGVPLRSPLGARMRASAYLPFFFLGQVSSAQALQRIDPDGTLSSVATAWSGWSVGSDLGMTPTGAYISHSKTGYIGVRKYDLNLNLVAESEEIPFRTGSPLVQGGQPNGMYISSSFGGDVFVRTYSGSTHNFYAFDPDTLELTASSENYYGGSSNYPSTFNYRGLGPRSGGGMHFEWQCARYALPGLGVIDSSAAVATPEPWGGYDFTTSAGVASGLWAVGQPDTAVVSGGIASPGYRSVFRLNTIDVADRVWGGQAAIHSSWGFSCWGTKLRGLLLYSGVSSLSQWPNIKNAIVPDVGYPPDWSHPLSDYVPVSIGSVGGSMVGPNGIIYLIYHSGSNIHKIVWIGPDGVKLGETPDVQLEFNFFASSTNIFKAGLPLYGEGWDDPGFSGY